MKLIREFLKYESTAGILLMISAIIALMMENSSLNVFYKGFLTIPGKVQIGEFVISKPLLLWVNDGLMAIFFLLVGLEIKREVLEGKLSKRDEMILPTVAAIGGIVFPSLIYIYFNYQDPESLRGWAIPAATDIAFALGIMTLLGKRVPENLKICLVAIAILDDLAAIVIIAIFYTENLSVLSLLVAMLAVLSLAILNKMRVKELSPYLFVGVILWACVLKSGVHATLAGVIMAIFIPLREKDKNGNSPAKTLEHSLHPWVSYLILPLFAFANAGVSLKGLTIEILMQPITLGIAAGLFFGKQLGIMTFTLLGVMLKVCKLPRYVDWKQYYGMSLITGVGFTMSLFIGTLAFDDPDNQTAVRLGVILGSLASGVLGYLILRMSSKKV